MCQHIDWRLKEKPSQDLEDVDQIFETCIAQTCLSVCQSDR